MLVRHYLRGSRELENWPQQARLTHHHCCIQRVRMAGIGGFYHTSRAVAIYACSCSYLLPTEILLSHNKRYSLRLTLINLEVEKWSLNHVRSCDCSLSVKNKIASVGMESHSYLKSEKQGFQRHLLLWFF